MLCVASAFTFGRRCVSPRCAPSSVSARRHRSAPLAISAWMPVARGRPTTTSPATAAPATSTPSPRTHTTASCCSGVSRETRAPPRPTPALSRAASAETPRPLGVACPLNPRRASFASGDVASLGDSDEAARRAAASSSRNAERARRASSARVAYVRAAASAASAAAAYALALETSLARFASLAPSRVVSESAARSSARSPLPQSRKDPVSLPGSASNRDVRTVGGAPETSRLAVRSSASPSSSLASPASRRSVDSPSNVGSRGASSSSSPASPDRRSSAETGRRLDLRSATRAARAEAAAARAAASAARRSLSARARRAPSAWGLRGRRARPTPPLSRATRTPARRRRRNPTRARRRPGARRRPARRTRRLSAAAVAWPQSRRRGAGRPRPRPVPCARARGARRRRPARAGPRMSCTAGRASCSPTESGPPAASGVQAFRENGSTESAISSAVGRRSGVRQSSRGRAGMADSRARGKAACARCDSNQARLGVRRDRRGGRDVAGTSSAVHAAGGRVVADASGTLRFDDSVEHGRDDAIARNRGRSEGRTSRCASRFDAEPPPDRDEGDPRRVISTPACAARCGGDGRSRRFAGSAELALLCSL